jgi:hypothetical protein
MSKVFDAAGKTHESKTIRELKKRIFFMARSYHKPVAPAVK